MATPEVGSRILLVDDDADVRRLIVRILSRAGFALVEAENGLQALERLSEMPFDAVITDMVMPGMDGPALIRDMRSRGGVPPILAISGGVREQEGEGLQAAESMGADAILNKPFTSADLVAAVRGLLG